MSESEFDILHRASVKNQAAHVLSWLKKKGKDKTLLDNEVSIRSIPQNIFSYAPQTEIADFEFIEDPRGSFVSYIPEFCTMEGITNNEQAKTPTLAELIMAQSSDVACRAVFTSIGKPNSRFNDDIDGVLVRVSHLHGVSKRVVPASLYPSFLHLSHCSLLTGRPVERRMYDPTRKKLC